MKFVVLSLFTLLSLNAQTGRTVKLSWTDNANPTGTTYSVKRANGLCAGTPTFNTISTGVTTKTYDDKNVPVGANYCYVVTATFGGLESSPSNTAGAAVNPAAPNLDGLTIAWLFFRIDNPPSTSVMQASIYVPQKDSTGE